MKKYFDLLRHWSASGLKIPVNSLSIKKFSRVNEAYLLGYEAAMRRVQIVGVLNETEREEVE